jgi:hypothetical protein
MRLLTPTRMYVPLISEMYVANKEICSHQARIRLEKVQSRLEKANKVLENIKIKPEMVKRRLGKAETK